MTTCRSEVSDEREQLMKSFVQTATEVCHLLRYLLNSNKKDKVYKITTLNLSKKLQ